MAKPKRLLAERLWSRLEPDLNSGCWLWNGPVWANGYGVIGRGGRDGGTFGAHRAAWEVTNGPIPPGMNVCHRCDTPPCINPAHLFLGTTADNIADKTAKGRTPHGERQYSAYLTEDLVREMRAAHGRGHSTAAIARVVGMNYGNISAVLRNKSWRHLL